jgi:hypothetical protein
MEVGLFRIAPSVTPVAWASVLKCCADCLDDSSMVLIHRSAQAAAVDRDSTAIDMEHVNQIVGQLFTEIEDLRAERDCLRSALVDAGFSIRAERIAHYAHRSRKGPQPKPCPLD